jgi:hypothetical protein
MKRLDEMTEPELAALMKDCARAVESVLMGRAIARAVREAVST